MHDKLHEFEITGLHFHFKVSLCVLVFGGVSSESNQVSEASVAAGGSIFCPMAFTLHDCRDALVPLGSLDYTLTSIDTRIR